MNAIVTRKEILAGFAVAGITLCLGFYFCMTAGGEAGTALMRIFSLLAVLIVLAMPQPRC